MLHKTSKNTKKTSQSRASLASGHDQSPCRTSNININVLLSLYDMDCRPNHGHDHHPIPFSTLHPPRDLSMTPITLHVSVPCLVVDSATRTRRSKM